MAIGKAGGSSMSYVYILQSEKNGRYYIGSTNDLQRRVSEHNSGQTASLLHLRPMKVVFYKEYDNMVEARRIERKLKRFKSRRIIERIVMEKDIKLGP